MTKDASEATSGTVASTTTTTSTEPPTTGGTSSTTASNNSSTPPTNSSTISHDALLSSLCSSCDSCRTRKTKCDGRRPCGSCTAKYLKKLKVESIAALSEEQRKQLVETCVYSVAKRRGPAPGSKAKALVNNIGAPTPSAGTTRKADYITTKSDDSFDSVAAAEGKHPVSQFSGLPSDYGTSRANAACAVTAVPSDMWMNRNEDISRLGSIGGGQIDIQGGMYNNLVNGLTSEEVLTLFQRQQQMLYGANLGMMGMGLGFGLGTCALNPTSAAVPPPVPLNYFQQLQAAQQMQLAGAESDGMASSSLQFLQQQLQAQSLLAGEDVRRLRARVEKQAGAEIAVMKISDQHLRLLSKSSLEGNRLRSYYELSVNELLNLPPIPSDEEYCRSLPIPLESPRLLPRFDLAALNSARFAELAIGAHVCNQAVLSTELSNATVACLKDCVEEPIHPMCMFDMARAYFLHAYLLSVKGDLERYFKYRRVCLTSISRLDANVPGLYELLAAISFHDSWAYILHNADVTALPRIDDFIPPLPVSEKKSKDLKEKLARGLTDTDSLSIVVNPDNQMWIQGVPPVFINNEAPPLARSLDALACAVRSCCDQANKQFEKMAKLMVEDTHRGLLNMNNIDTPISSTGTAVTARENELCSRNLLLSAATLLRQYEASALNATSRIGHRMAVHLMDAFLTDNGDENGGFSGEQIKNLLSACKLIVDHPMLLHQPGPMYHMASNATVLLCHLLNGLYSNLPGESSGRLEIQLFDEVLDTFTCVRNLLDCHRKNLPVQQRCHGIPRPNLSLLNVKNYENSDRPFIDLGKTCMCFCRGCQGFVLVACSPCVAAEKAQSARLKQQESKGKVDPDLDLDRELNDLGIELNLDDDALLNVLSRILQM